MSRCVSIIGPSRPKASTENRGCIFPGSLSKWSGKGIESVVAERLREQYEVRARARLERNADKSAEPSAEPTASMSDVKPQSLEEIRRQAREDWLRLRQELSSSTTDNRAGRSAGREPGAEDNNFYEDGLHQ